MAYTLSLLEQIADGLARQFGPDCEIVIHDLSATTWNTLLYTSTTDISPTGVKATDHLR